MGKQFRENSMFQMTWGKSGKWRADFIRMGEGDKYQRRGVSRIIFECQLLFIYLKLHEVCKSCKVYTLSISHLGWQWFPQIYTYPTKILTPETSSLCWSGLSKRLPKHRLSLKSLVGPYKWKVYFRSSTYFRNRAQWTHAGSDLKVSSMRSSFHGTRSLQSNFRGRKAKNCPIQLCRAWPTTMTSMAW